MAHEVAVVLLVVVGDDLPTATAQLRDLRGRELSGVPGSWISRVAVHPDLDVLRGKLQPAAPADSGSAHTPGPHPDGTGIPDTDGDDVGDEDTDPDFDALDDDDDPARRLY